VLRQGDRGRRIRVSRVGGRAARRRAPREVLHAKAGLQRLRQRFRQLLRARMLPV